MKYFTQLMEEVVAPEGGNPQGGGEVSSPSWFYSAPNEETQFEGVAGNGEVPDWFVVDKYKSVEEQAKGYKELSKKFGDFTGSPEEYQIPETLQDFELDDNMLGILKEVGKNHNMGQNMFNDLVSKVVEYQAQQNEAMTKTAMEKLGPQAQERISNVQNWLNTNAPKEVIDMIAPMATSAEAIQALEFFISKTKNSSVANETTTPEKKISQAEYAEMLMAKDKSGQLKMNSDPDYRKRMNELALQFQR